MNSNSTTTKTNGTIAKKKNTDDTIARVSDSSVRGALHDLVAVVAEMVSRVPMAEDEASFRDRVHVAIGDLVMWLEADRQIEANRRSHDPPPPPPSPSEIHRAAVSVCEDLISIHNRLELIFLALGAADDTHEVAVARDGISAVSAEVNEIRKRLGEARSE